MIRQIYVPPVEIPERVHDDGHLLLWQVQGGSEITVEGESHQLAMGYALWIPAAARHSLKVSANSVVLPMFFGLQENATSLRVVTVIPVERDLRTLFLAHIQLENSIIRPPVNIARQILAVIERRPVLSAGVPMPVTPAAAGIAEVLVFNPGDDRTVEELASQAHTSARTIERAFKAETGVTLRRWRIVNRMEAAARLLGEGSVVDAVAHRVGYLSASAFRRAFKDHFGMAPGEYVARYRVER